MPQRPPDLALSETPSADYDDYAKPLEPTTAYSVAQPPPSAHSTLSRPYYANTFPTPAGHSVPLSYQPSDAAESLSEWSAASYSHPASLRNDQGERPWSPSHNLAPYAKALPVEMAAGNEGISEKMHKETYVTMASPTGGDSQVHRQVISYSREDEAQKPSQPEEHALWVLFFLSFFMPPFSFLAALYTLIMLVLVLFALPFRICQSTWSVKQQLISSLAPFLRAHLRLLCSPSLGRGSRQEYRPFFLVLTLLAFPFASIGVSIAAWVSACFWIFAAMMGNPDGTERGDDGRAAVMGVRGWCEKQLLRAVQ